MPAHLITPFENVIFKSQLQNPEHELPMLAINGCSLQGVFRTLIKYYINR
jgi:hypothetical protein